MAAERPRTSAATRFLAGAARRGGPFHLVASRFERLRLRGPAYLLKGRQRALGQQRALDDAREQAYRTIWNRAARELGADVEEFSPGFFFIRRDGRETMVHRDIVMLDSPATIDLASDKAVLQELLRREGLPVVPFTEVPMGEAASVVAHARSLEGPYVVKPARGTGGGQGVTCGVVSDEDVVQAWLLASLYAPSVIVERQVFGDEYRLLLLDGELLGAVRRRPPHVVGDGRRNVGELIAEVNEGRAGDSAEVNRLVHVDLDCRLALAREGLSLGSVPAAGRRVAVKGSASENGRLDNRTWEAFAPEVLGAARRAARISRLRLAGIDVVTPDPMLPLEVAGGAIVEVNGTPGLRHHYQVAAESPAEEVAVPLLRLLLDEAAEADGADGAGDVAGPTTRA
jgi:cyanophycin synthetase